VTTKTRNGLPAGFGAGGAAPSRILKRSWMVFFCTTANEARVENEGAEPCEFTRGRGEGEMQNAPKEIANHRERGVLQGQKLSGRSGRGAVKCRMPPRRLQITGEGCSRGRS
jgi:hypothetical protein